MLIACSLQISHLSTCIHVFIHVIKFSCIYVCIFIFVFMFVIFMYLCCYILHLLTFVLVFVHVFMFSYLYMYSSCSHVWVCTCIQACLQMSNLSRVALYIYIHMCTQTHFHLQVLLLYVDCRILLVFQMFIRKPCE